MCPVYQAAYELQQLLLVNSSAASTIPDASMSISYIHIEFWLSNFECPPKVSGGLLSWSNALRNLSSRRLQRILWRTLCVLWENSQKRSHRQRCVYILLHKEVAQSRLPTYVNQRRHQVYQQVTYGCGQNYNKVDSHWSWQWCRLTTPPILHLQRDPYRR
jgi:hypothetical protein